MFIHGFYFSLDEIKTVESRFEICEMTDSCEERVRIPGIIHMEGEEEDTVKLSVETVRDLKLNIPLKIAVDGAETGNNYVHLGKGKQKPSWVSPCSKYVRYIICIVGLSENVHCVSHATNICFLQIRRSILHPDLETLIPNQRGGKFCQYATDRYHDTGVLLGGLRGRGNLVPGHTLTQRHQH